MHLKIIAIADTPTPDERLRWKANIQSETNTIKTDLALIDPLTTGEKTRCRWYLEKHTEDPFAVSRARDAVSYLERYRQSLAQQLQLSDIRVPDDESLLIEVEDASGSAADPQASAHQLHWELLEDQDVWRNAKSVQVRRLTWAPSRTISPINRIQSWSHSEGTLRTINVLLVTARDLTPDPKANTDVDPSIASDVLASVQSHLRAVKSPVELNVEIVRPGTFKAFEKHLERSSLTHGPGFFHIVHFDMHGKVSTKGQKKFGFLYFKNPGSLTTTAVPAVNVAKIVKEYAVPIVILNACESARANAGDDANIAKTFSRVGVKSILAMSYKATQCAATKFLAAFYQQFLQSGKTLAAAAAAARSELRSDPVRPARYRRTLKLQDWFVPVVYTSSPELRLSRPVPSPQTPKPITATDFTDETKLYGRDFDLLRVESALAESKNESIYISGAVAVGKSALLRHAASRWRSTSFVDVVLYLDFSNWSPTNIECVLKEMRQQLEAQGHKEDDRPMQEIRSQLELLGIAKRVPKPNGSTESAADSLKEFLAGFRAVFILDGALDRRLQQYSEKACAHQQTIMSQILQFIDSARALRARAVEEDGDIQWNHVLVVSGRAREPPQDMRNAVQAVYNLESLRLDDCLDLLQGKTHRPGAANHESPREALKRSQKFVPLANLLDGNAGALVLASSMLRASTLTPRDVYDILHGENIMLRMDTSVLDAEDNIFLEMSSRFRSLHDDSLAVLILLSWFWHEGPYESELSELLVERNIIQSKEAVSVALKAATSWLYINVESDGRISWIHPLMTIYARMFACSRLSGFDFVAGKTWASFRSRFSEKHFRHLTPNCDETPPTSVQARGLKYAVWLTVTVLCSHPSRDTNPLYWVYLIFYLPLYTNMGKRFNLAVLQQGIDYEGSDDVYRKCKQNHLLAMRLCRGRGPLPLPIAGWPSTFMPGQEHFIRRRSTVEEIRITVEYLEQLFRGSAIVSRKQGRRNAVPPKELAEIIQLGQALAETYRKDLPDAEGKNWEVIKFTEELIAETEAEYGVSKDPGFSAMRSLLSIAKATAYAGESHTEKSRSAWHDAMSEVRLAYDPNSTEYQSRMNAALADKSPEEAEIVRTGMAKFGASMNRLEDSWEMTLDHMLGNITSGVSEIRPATVRTGDSWDAYLDGIGDAFYQLNKPEENLIKLDEEIERGNWRREQSYHGGLAMVAMKNLNFDVALEHFAAQIDLSRGHEDDDKLDQRYEEAKQLTADFKFIATINGRKGDDQEFQAALERITSLLEKKKKLTPEFRALLTYAQNGVLGTKKEEDWSLPHNQGPSVLNPNVSVSAALKVALKEHLLRATRDTNYQREFHAMERKFLETLDLLEKAEDAGCVKDIFENLDKLEDFGKQKTFSQLVPAERVQSRRDWNVARLIRDIVDRQKALFSERKFEQCIEEADRLVMVLKKGGISVNPEMQQAMDKVKSTAESGILLELWNPAHEARLRNDMAAAIPQYDTILARRDRGDFSYALRDESVDVAQIFEDCLLERAMAKTFLAKDGRRWEDLKAVCEEIRQDEDLLRLVEKSRYREVVGAAERLANDDLAHFFFDLKALDFHLATKHLDKMRQAKNSPHSSAIVKFCGELLSKATFAMIMQGPDAAKTAVSNAFPLDDEPAKSPLDVGPPLVNAVA
jgi:hypothetical protein